MGTAFNRVDIVHIGVDILAVVGVIHHGHLDGDTLFLCLQVDDVIHEVGTVTIHVAHELLQTVLSVEHLLLQLALLIGTHVLQCDGDAGIQVGQLTHATGNDIVFVFCRCEDGAVGPELLTGTRLVGVTHDLHVVEGLTLLVLLLVDVTVAEHLRHHVRGEGVHTGDTYTVQTAGHLVGALVELTAGMEHGHHDLKGRLMHLLMLIDGDTTTVVQYSDAVIFVDRYFDMCTIAGHRLVDRVIDGLIDQMVETLFTNVTDVHGRALAHGFQSLKHLNIARGIVLFLVQLFFCHFLLDSLSGCKGTKIFSDKHSLSAKKLQKNNRNPFGLRSKLCWMSIIPAY